MIKLGYYTDTTKWHKYFTGLKNVDETKYPDGTYSSRLPFESDQYCDIYNTIVWLYDSMEELFLVKAIAKRYSELGIPVSLLMPYIPNARMDRVKSSMDIPYLKYMCEEINSCLFDRVTVLDLHSSVSEALIDRLNALKPEFAFSDSMKRMCGMFDALAESQYISNMLIFYPDEGSMKRYDGLFKHEYLFGIKNRDWKTGEILSLEIAGNPKDNLEGKDILIIDDICSAGGTFYYSAKALKELGANRIFLYVTHLEKTILKDGNLQRLLGTNDNDKLIEKIFTTDSIFRNPDWNGIEEYKDRIEVIYKCVE